MINDKKLNKEKYPEFKSINEIKDFLSKTHSIRSPFKVILLIGLEKMKKEISSLFKSNFLYEEKDDFLIIKKRDEKTKEITFTGYLLQQDNKEGIIFYTLLTYSINKQIKKCIFNHLVERSSLINKLWISHNLTMNLIDYLLEKEGRFTLIKGYYSPSFERKPNIRPDFYRKIKYEGNDAIYSYYELRQLYGINVEHFKCKISRKFFHFYRKRAVFTFKQGSLDFFLEICKWLFDNALSYLKEIRKFTKKVYRSSLIDREYQISNNLIIRFKDRIPELVLKELVKILEKSRDIEILNKITNEDVYANEGIDESKIKIETFYDLKILNKNKYGFFNVKINSKLTEITQISKSNFIGVIPILDILDYTNPKNEIIIIEA